MRAGARLLLVGALAVYGVALAQRLDLTTVDLGRHLKNGELFITQRTLLSTNFYSYTEPDHPAVNHHWGSGVIFYLVWKLGGFSGLHLFFIGLSLVALALLWRIAAQRGGGGLTALVFILVAPLLAERRELRPEVFSYVFGAVFLHRLWRVRDGQATARSLWWLPLVEMIWANTHIYFCLGPAFIGAFLAESLIYRDRRPLATSLSAVLTATLAVTLLNPFGLEGVLAPLTIFQEYGYRVLENQPVWFLEPLVPKTNFLLFKIVFWMLMASLIMAWAMAHQRLLAAETFLGLGVGVLGWLALRNFALFGFVALVVLAGSLGALVQARHARRPGWWTGAGALANVVVLGLMLNGRSGLLVPPIRAPGLGVAPGNAAAAQFILRERLDGPIFNNYDIGGYLIFHLFPRHRVFVDNRPEAYSAAFFKEVYVPMQEDETIWQRVDAQYGFNAIVFHRHDLTPWGQPFLIRRIDDPLWAPVFVDHDTIIFLKRNERNRPVIERFEIPRSEFQVIKTRP